jgi:hypothetical protein
VTTVSSVERAPGSPKSRDLAEGLFGAFDAPIAPKAEPAQYLYDMRLPTSPYQQNMMPVLHTLGGQIEDAEVVDYPSGDRHQFTLLTKGDARRLLLLVPDEILRVYSRTVKAVLFDVLDLILARYDSSLLYVIHRSNPHAIYRTTLNDWAEKESFGISFIPLSDLDYYFIEQQAAASQEQFLTANFSLPAAVARAAPQTRYISRLPTNETERVAQIITDIPSFKDDAAARRTLVEMAGLEDAVGDINYGQPPGQVAWMITRRSLRHGITGGPDDSRHTFHLLLSHLAAIPELSQSDRAFINMILEQYDFGPEPG